jgi:hypothetical protein
VFEQVGTPFTVTATNNRRLSIWRARATAAFSGAVTISFGATATACLWSILKFSGTNPYGSNGSGAVVQASTGATGTSTDIAAAALAAFENGRNLCVSFEMTDSGTIAQTDFTLGGTATAATPTSRIHSQHRVNDPTATATASAGTVSWGTQAVEVRAY